MTRRRLLVVDHYFHQKTQSSSFFKDILKQNFEVCEIYIRPGFLPDFHALPFDVAVLWQVDFLAPSFLARGIPTVIVQMFDGSSNLSDTFWRVCKQARFINFSLSMHARALHNGAQSLLVRYFPDTNSFRQTDDFSTLRLFYWRRLSSPEFSLERLSALLAGRLDSVHVHLAHDPDNDSFEPASLEDLFRCEVSTSNWLAEKAEYDQIVDRCNVFFAPRYAEGIGHSFLEGMARGMVTIAYDLPTHNEYISNWKTGVLFNSLSKAVDLEKIRTLGSRIGSDARSFIAHGHENWLASEENIVAFVDQTQSPSYLGYDRLEAEADLMSQRLAMGKTGEDFAEMFPVTTALLSSSTFVSDKSAFNFPIWSDKINIVFGEGNHKEFIGSGWSVPEQTHVWSIARSAFVFFDSSKLDGTSLLQIEVRSVSAEKELSIHFDGVRIGCVTINPSLQSYVFCLGQLQAGVREIRFDVLELESAPSDPRTLAFLCRSIRIGDLSTPNL